MPLMIPQLVGEKNERTFSFLPLSLIITYFATYRLFHWLAWKMNVWMMMHVCNLEFLPKNIAQNKSLFIDFIRLHIVQHITIVSIECLHLLTVVPNFFYEIQQLLPILSDGEETLMECLRLSKYLVSFANDLVDLLDRVFDIKLSG